MNLTKEHFDKALKGLATKADLDKQAAALMAYSDNQVEALAVMVQKGFEEIKSMLDVTDRVGQLEKDVKKIKDALHVR
jgi:hypothetical protein